MKRPHVICHMASSVDGRIISENWGSGKRRKQFYASYEKCHASFASEAWMCGRVTLEKDFTNGKKPERVQSGKRIAHEPFNGNKDATSFVIAVDAKGKLGWESNNIDGDHIIEILSQQVKNAYLNYLQTKSISYIFAGEKEIDFRDALQQLVKLFPIKTIMLEGGGHINGSLLNEGLIDELSLLIIPVADGTLNTPTTFDVSEFLQKKPATLLRLVDLQQLENDVVWLKYRMNSK